MIDRIGIIDGSLMDLRQLATFRVVADELSFSRAAGKLGYVQSSVSAQVAALEQELGTPLFDRLGRRVILTEPGRVLLAYASRLHDLADEARTAVTDAGAGSGQLTGTLTVSAPETLLTYRLPKLLALFHRKHPRVRLSVRPSSVGRLAGSTRKAVEDGTVDLAFVLDVPTRAPGLTVQPLAEEDVVVITAAAQESVATGPAGVADLATTTLLLPEAPEHGCAYRGQFERQLAAAGVAPQERMEFQSIEAVKQCVAAGMGVSALPRVTIETELAAGTLVAVPWQERFDVRTQFAWREQRWQSPAMRAFLATVHEVFPTSTDGRRKVSARDDRGDAASAPRPGP